MLTFREAAIKILITSEKSIHYKQITKIAIKKKLIDTYCDTPENTMYFQIAKDIKLYKEKSSFIKVKPGIFKINFKNNDTLWK